MMIFPLSGNDIPDHCRPPQRSLGSSKHPGLTCADDTFERLTLGIQYTYSLGTQKSASER